jgi:hypothetical protein
MSSLKSSFTLFTLLVSLLLLCPVGEAAAQTNSNITGVVVDPQGAVIAGADVTVRSADGSVLRTTTDGDGRYRADGLAPGLYAVTFEAQGFKNYVVEGVVVGEGAAAQDVELEVGAVEAMAGAVAVSSVANALVWHTSERDAARRAAGRDDDDEPDPLVVRLFESDESFDAVLAEVGADARLEFGDTILMYVASDEERLEKVLALGADASARDQFGATVLMRAALSNESRPIRLLVRAGADVNAADENGLTALMVAALEDNEDAVETLLLAGADPRVADRDGKTALDHAKDEENDAVVEILELALSH